MSVLEELVVVKRYWRGRCMHAARLMRREADEHERLGHHGRADKARRRAQFWVREARAWNRSLVSWARRGRRRELVT